MVRPALELRGRAVPAHVPTVQGGDTIAAAGVIGCVREIGLFVTAIDTQDNVADLRRNNRLFSDNVQNFSANDYRPCRLTAPLQPGADVDGTIARLRDVSSPLRRSCIRRSQS